MNKPTITEALQARIPLPWKQSTCDGPPIWKVERQRPEDFTAEIYQQLRKYGMKEDEIRNLFYIKNEDYGRLKQELGATVPVECVEESKKQIGRRLKNFMPRGPKQATVAPKDRPQIAVEPEPDAAPHEPTADEIADVFRPEATLTLRTCAEKLVAAIDAREAADKQIEYYTSEIRRLA